MTSTLEAFARLFQGRFDVYGTDAGGAEYVKCATAGEYVRRVQLHLQGSKPMGVYPLLDDLTVHWGCVDLDYTDDPTDSFNLQAVLREFDVTAWVERSRSKGFHTWVFADHPVEASAMREALVAACKVVDVSTKEVNPKQTTREHLDRGVGNYVRLPYPGHSLPNGVDFHHPRQVMTNANGCYRLKDWVEAAYRSRCTPESIHMVRSQLHVPPPPPARAVLPPETAWTARSHNAVERMNGLAYTIWRDGPRPGVDRSSTVWNLITALVRDGRHTESEIVELVCDADVRWGKYHLRPNGRALIERQVSKACGGS